MLASRPPRTTRRRVLAVGVATGSVVLGGSACDLVAGTGEPGASGPETPPTTPPPTSSATSTADDDDVDQRLAGRVADDISSTLAVVTAAGRGRRQLARRLRGLARTHRAHLEELPGGDDPGRVQVRGDDGAALRRVRAAEKRLQRRLAEAAVAAESGPLAARLASMSAAVAQQLASEPLT